MTVLTAGLWQTATADAQDGTTVYVGEVTEGDSLIRVPVATRNVENLGAFSFVLQFNGAVLEATAINRGEFLGSGGRETFCDDPTIDTDAVRFSCVTLGADPPTGVSGEGILAVVEFESIGDGSSPLTLDRVTLARPNSTEIFVSSLEDGSYNASDDGGSATWFYVAVIGGAVVVAGVATMVYRARRSRGRTTEIDPAR
jgi:hypothetical protein